MTDMDLGDTRLIVDECGTRGLSLQQAAYILATAFWETARTMKPVREALASTDQQAIARLERAWAKGQLKWVKTPYWRDGFFGRGYVQLTHKENYEVAGKHLCVNLKNNPQKALEPEIAAKVLVIGCRDGWFTGKKLSRYIGDGKADYVNARRVVNGTDKAKVIAALAEEYEEALRAEEYDAPRKNWLTALIEAIARIFK